MIVLKSLRLLHPPIKWCWKKKKIKKNNQGHLSFYSFTFYSFTTRVLHCQKIIFGWILKFILSLRFQVTVPKVQTFCFALFICWDSLCVSVLVSSHHTFNYSGMFWHRHVLPMSSMAFSGYSSSLPHSTGMQSEDWWIGYFNLALGVNRSMNSCLSQYVNPAMSEWLSRVYSASYPKGAGEDFCPWDWITTAHTVRVFVLVEFRSRSTCGSSLRGDDLR